jgi:FkbM family methyltransferase
MLPRRTKKLVKLVRLLAHGDYRAALRKGRVAAAIEHERLLKTMDFATVVDIGANRGQFALVSRHCYPTANIVSFEPLAAPSRRFRAVLDSDKRVTFHQVAVGAACSEAVMHVSARDDSSSLLPISALQESLFSGTSEVGTETVQVVPLEQRLPADQIQPPALLKLDVQGYELTTLQGCESLLHLFANVYVECSFVQLYEGQSLADDVIAYLRQHGFGLQGIYNVHYDPAGRAIQADFLFSPSK